MNVYIDHEFKCHIDNDGSMIKVHTDRFEGKCKAFIEGYRFVPAGESWTREDGEVFSGEMIAPWKPFEELEQAQRQHELDLAKAALILLGEVNE